MNDEPEIRKGPRDTSAQPSIVANIDTCRFYVQVLAYLSPKVANPLNACFPD